jgi:hypothetical protein
LNSSASLTTPPNHNKFANLANPDKLASSLLQQCWQAAEKNNQPPAAPPVHIHLPQQAFGAQVFNQVAPPALPMINLPVLHTNLLLLTSVHAILLPLTFTTDSLKMVSLLHWC